MTQLTDGLALAREISGICRDWSDGRKSGDASELGRRLSAAAEASILTRIRRLDKDGNEGQRVACIHPADGISRAYPCSEDETLTREAVRQSRIAQSSRTMANLSARERADAWRRERWVVMGPVRSWLPVMDDWQQREMAPACGCHRNMLTPKTNDLARAGHPSIVCQGGKVAPRAKNRRSTRGKGRHCR